MYYEEKLIDGLLMFRTKPDGIWQQCDIKKVSQRLVEAECKIKAMNKDWYEECRKAREGGYLDGKQYEKDRIKEMLGLC